MTQDSSHGDYIDSPSAETPAPPYRITALSQLALDIIHPDPTKPQSEKRALYDAALSPQIFKDLRTRFPDHVSEDSLKSFLIREGFNNVAINPLTSAYFDTFRFLEQSKVFESGGIGDENEGESGQSDDDWNDNMDEAVTMERPVAINWGQVAVHAPNPAQSLNRIDMDIKGDRVQLNALLDLNGIASLEKKIAALKLLLDAPTDLEGDSDE